MILAFWCVLIAGLMPVGYVGVAKFVVGSRKMGLKDNHHPRKWLEESEGPQKRAYWAQLNSFEAFPLFAAGVIIAFVAGGSLVWINTVAVLFVILRAVYGACYIADKAELRSLVWFAATGCSILLFIIGAIG